MNARERSATLPSVAQMANRANNGHRRALRAYHDDTMIATEGTGDIRGMVVILATLRRWQCISGDEITARGQELLDVLDAGTHRRRDRDRRPDADEADQERKDYG
jgi:hypothetical protein